MSVFILRSVLVLGGRFTLWLICMGVKFMCVIFVLSLLLVSLVVWEFIFTEQISILNFTKHKHSLKSLCSYELTILKMLKIVNSSYDGFFTYVRSVALWTLHLHVFEFFKE